MARVADAWAVPFYRQRWTAAGLEPGDVRSIDDSERIPTFNSDDLKAAIAEHPPFGSHHPFGPEGFGRQPLKIQTSGGTTGLPRVTLFDAVAMEVQGIQTARALYAQGTRPGDVVQITYTNSLANSAWCALSGIQNWLGAVPMTTGAGQVTPSERQLEYAAAWGTTAWFSRGEYLARLAQVAQETGLDLRTLRTRQIHSFLGPDTEGHLRARLEASSPSSAGRRTGCTSTRTRCSSSSRTSTTARPSRTAPAGTWWPPACTGACRPSSASTCAT
jgi:phenylacetate-CoA ligase